MPQATTPDADTADGDDQPLQNPAVTVYHLDRSKFDSIEEFTDKFVDFDRNGWTLNKDAFESYYTPVETILDEDDLEDAFVNSQGFKVNERCDARHGVRSTQPNDVLKLIHPDGTVELHAVDAIGFTELNFTPEN